MKNGSFLKKSGFAGFIVLLLLCGSIDPASAVINENPENHRLQVKEKVKDPKGQVVKGAVFASPEKSQIPEYAPGQIIVKLRKGKTLEDIRDLNDTYSVTGSEKIFKDTPDPKEVLQQLKEKLATPDTDHGSWYWQLDKDSKEYKDYQTKIAKEKETLAQEIKTQEELIAHLEKRQMRASGDTVTPQLDNIYLLEVDKKTDIPALVAVYKTDPAVEYAQPNHKNEVFMVPNDPYYASSNSWGQGYDDLWGLKKIHADQAWDISQGKGTVVAVIDTGIDNNHEDLAANIWTNARETPDNGIDDDANGKVDDVKGWNFSEDSNDTTDYFGHGTHCAGTIAAIGNNSKGIIGVAPQAKIMPVRIFPNAYDSVCADAIKYATDNGADTLSNSWGPGSRRASNPLIEDAIDYAYARGCIIVFAAGNNNDNVGYYSPANYSKVITVAAGTHSDERADFSNFGHKIDVTAPGGDSAFSSPNYAYENILSLRASDTDMYRDGINIVGTNYYRARGTSMACPHVAGVASLILSHHPTLSSEEIRSILRVSADDIDSAGFDQNTGAGRLNAVKALTTVGSPCIATISSPKQAEFATNSGSIAIRGSAAGQGFISYAIEFGSGSAPALWTTINSSTSPVQNGVLGTWNIPASIADGICILRLTVKGSNGSAYRSYCQIIVVKNQHPGWPRDFQLFELPARIADIDKDGLKEIAFASFHAGSACKTNAIKHNGEFLSGWPIIWAQIGPPLDAVIGDIHGDGLNEVISAPPFGPIYAFNSEGKIVPGWPQGTMPLSDHIEQPLFIMLSDLDGMGDDEIIASTVDQKIINGQLEVSSKISVWRGDGTLLSGWPQTLPDADSKMILMANADVNGDGVTEIVVLQERKYYSESGGGPYPESICYVFNPQGRLLPGWPVVLAPPPPATNIVQQKQQLDNAPVLGDLTGDGLPEIIFTTFYSEYDNNTSTSYIHKQIHALKYDGTAVPNWPINADFLFPDGWGTLTGATLGDLNNDGMPEVIVSTGTGNPGTFKIGVFQANGSLLPGWPVKQSGSNWPSQVLIADVDGDSYSDLIVGNYEQVCVWNRNGIMLSGWPKYLPGYSNYSPAVEDVDGDSKLELLVGGGLNTPLVLFDLDGPANPHTLQWPMLGHDAKNTGNFHFGVKDRTAPTTPRASGIFVAATKALIGSWCCSLDPESGIVEYQFRITRDSATGTVVKDWTSAGTSTGYMVTGLNLQFNKTYYFQIKAKNGVGLWSKVGISNGVLIPDITPPSTPIVDDNAVYTTTNTTLSAACTLAWVNSNPDPESGIAEYQYQIRQDSATGAIIKNWASCDKNYYFVANGLNLINGKTYYMGMKAKNDAGLWSATGWTNGIKIDTTAPTTPVVTDAGDYTSSATTLTASWISSDPESGIAEYKYRITQDSATGTVIRNWTSTGKTASAQATGLFLQQGKTYYFGVSVKNNAGGLSTVGYSNGIKVDATPPVKPTVSGGIVPGSTTSLTASWYGASDPESGLHLTSRYRYRIHQDSPTGIIIKSWTSTGITASVIATQLPLTKGKYYFFEVQAANGANLWSASGYSKGIRALYSDFITKKLGDVSMVFKNTRSVP